jgi:hypothetical protein
VVVQEEVDHLMRVLVVDVLNVLINLKAKPHLQQMKQLHWIKVVNLGVLKQVPVVVEDEVDHDVETLKAVAEASKVVVETSKEAVVLVDEVAVVVGVEISIIEIKKKVHNKKLMIGNKVPST